MCSRRYAEDKSFNKQIVLKSEKYCMENNQIS